MKSFTTPDFWQAYAALSPDIKAKTKKAYRLWQNDQAHPSVHFKKVGKNLWSSRISGGHRALALKKGDDYYWFWVGDHDEYESLLK